MFMFSFRSPVLFSYPAAFSTVYHLIYWVFLESVLPIIGWRFYSERGIVYAIFFFSFLACID